MENKSFLGTGWSFPPTFDPASRSVVMVSEEEDIAQSLRIILFTSFGERIMLPEFGSNLDHSVFQPVDSSLINTLSESVRSSVMRFEPRITLHGVEVNNDESVEGRLNIKLDYSIRLTNVRTNIVFPFYFKEGTNVTGM